MSRHDFDNQRQCLGITEFVTGRHGQVHNPVVGDLRHIGHDGTL